VSDQEVPRPSDAPSAPKSPPPESPWSGDPHGAPPVSPWSGDPAGATPPASPWSGDLPGAPPPPPGGGPPYSSAPPGGYEPPQPPAAEPLPWEAREQYGFLKALADTALLFTQRPRAAFERAKTKGDYASPLLWVLIFGIFGAAIQWLWGVMFLQTWLTMLPPDVTDQMGPFLTGMVGAGSVITFFYSLVGILLGTIVNTVIIHVSLLVAGGGKDSPSGFEGTFRTACYPGLAMVAQAIPFVGSLISLVWFIIMQIIGLSAMHRISIGKAFVVWLIPIFLCCACAAVGAALFSAAIFSAAGMHGN